VNRRRSGKTGLLLLMCAVLAAGCGAEKREELPQAKVTGTVKYAGHDIPKGRIVFQHERGDMTAAEFGADGKYEVMLPVGKNLAIIDAKSSSYDDSPKGGGRGMEIFTHHVPQRYADFGSAKLSVDVPAAGTTFDVAVVD
jgi:hypothetical protein